MAGNFFGRYVVSFLYFCSMEMLYHYLWKHKVFGSQLRLTDGRPVEILSPGVHNNDAGPDFSWAKVRIDDTEWAGNVEIHVKASDWHRHGHHTDPAYDNVLLHVVAVDDTPIHRADGSVIPQLEVVMPPDFLQMYASLVKGIDNVRCLPYMPSLHPLIVTDWMESLAVERLISKAQHIIEIYKQTAYDWAQTLFIVLARSLGFGLNGLPFELMAKATPLKFLFRHADDRKQIEAMLFGQAGMLDPSANIFDEYYSLLCREYFFLAKKYGLRPISASLWKYARTRPQNFPHRRIAILASAITTEFKLLDRLLEAHGDEDRLAEIFEWKASPYWYEHSDFGHPISQIQHLTLSPQSVNLLMINLAAPFYYAYGSIHGEPDIAEYAVNLLMSLPPEKNFITVQFAKGGIKAKDAMRTQAMIHLRKEYCDPQRCLECRFGHALLKNQTSNPSKLYSHSSCIQK